MKYYRPNLSNIFCRYFFLFVVILGGCKKYLDKKPNEALIIPKSIQDASLLLDDYATMNNKYPFLGTLSDDNSYFLDAVYDSRPITEKDIYTWQKSAIANEDWTRLYKIVASANIALETLSRIQVDANNINEYHRVKGSALFYRAYAFFHIAQYYADPYEEATASQKLGIPLLFSADITSPNTRSTLKETYERIISDFTESSKILPDNNPPLSRPNKAAAFAALARTYLTVSNFGLAKKYADSCLLVKNSLMNFNNNPPVTPTSNTPFRRFNAEVIFHAVNVGVSIASQTTGKIDSTLYQSYNSDDRRKVVFFRSVSPGFSFKGNYDQTTAGSNFSGLAVDEIYLIRAECNARLGDKVSAMTDLNTLLISRWKTGTFIPYTASSDADALQKILEERRKELVGRGLRWFDLRRLNKDPNFAVTLSRVIAGQTYTLPSNDSRYTFYIPEQVISLTGMQQNTR